MDRDLHPAQRGTLRNPLQTSAAADVALSHCGYRSEHANACHSCQCSSMSSAASFAPAAAEAAPAPAGLAALPSSEFLSVGAGIKEKLAAMKAQKLAAKQKRAAAAAAAAGADQTQQEFLSLDDSAADDFAHSVHEHALAGSSSPAAAASANSSPSADAAATPARPFANGEDFISFAAFVPPAAETPAAKQSGVKRKAGTALDGDDDDAANGGAAPVQVEGAFKAPWATGPYTHRNFTVRLHEELLDFCTYVSPKPEEQTMRAELIDRLNALVREAFPSSPRVHLKPFGSYATKLYLPISDIDLVLFDADEGGRFVPGDKGKQSPLGVLERHMRAKQCATYLEHISGARIPILKLTDKQTGVKVDICYDVAGGLRAAEFIVGMQRQLPALRPLTLFLKYFLHCRVLNDTYKGGIGSFMLQLMLISHLQALQQMGKLALPTTNLGMLLMSFLESYGVTLNYRVAGLSMNAAHHAAIAEAAAAVTSDENERAAVSATLQSSSSAARVAFYNKSSRGWANAGRPYLLSIENPLDASHDVGANSYLIMRVRKALQFAYQAISAYVFHENARLDRGEPLVTRAMKQAVMRAADPTHPFAAPSAHPLTLLSLIVSVNDELRADQEEVEFEELAGQAAEEDAHQRRRREHVHIIESSSEDEAQPTKLHFDVLQDEDAAGMAAAAMDASSASSDDDDDAASDSADSADGALDHAERDADVDAFAGSSDDDFGSAAASDDEDGEDEDDKDGDSDNDQDLSDLEDLDQRLLDGPNLSSSHRNARDHSSRSARRGGDDFIPLTGGGSAGGQKGGSRAHKKGKAYRFDNAASTPKKTKSSKKKKGAQLQRGVRSGGIKPNNGIFESQRSKDRKASKKKHDQARKKQRHH